MAAYSENVWDFLLNQKIGDVGRLRQGTDLRLGKVQMG